MCVLIPFLPAVTAYKARHVNDLLEQKTRLEPTCVGDLALFLSPPAPQGGMGSLVRAIVFNRRRKQKATHVGNSKVPQGPRLKGALCLVRGYTMQVFRRKTAKQKQHPHECCFYLERKTRLELATPTLARLCSTN